MESVVVTNETTSTANEVAAAPAPRTWGAPSLAAARSCGSTRAAARPALFKMEPVAEEEDAKCTAGQGRLDAGLRGDENGSKRSFCICLNVKLVHVLSPAPSPPSYVPSYPSPQKTYHD